MCLLIINLHLLTKTSRSHICNFTENCALKCSQIPVRFWESYIMDTHKKGQLIIRTFVVNEDTFGSARTPRHRLRPWQDSLLSFFILLLLIISILQSDCIITLVAYTVYCHRTRRPPFVIAPFPDWCRPWGRSRPLKNVMWAARPRLLTRFLGMALEKIAWK